MAPLLQSAPGLGTDELLECVVNVSEGRDERLLGRLAEAGRELLLDVHIDPDHNRSVFTMAGATGPLEDAVRALAAEVVRRADFTGTRRAP